MEYIYLSKQAKVLLKSITDSKECKLSKKERICAAHELSDKKIVKCGFISGGDYEFIQITSYGAIYVKNNPALLNPINWSLVSVLIAFATLVVSIVTLIITINK